MESLHYTLKLPMRDVLVISAPKTNKKISRLALRGTFRTIELTLPRRSAPAVRFKTHSTIKKQVRLYKLYENEFSVAGRIPCAQPRDGRLKSCYCRSLHSTK